MTSNDKKKGRSEVQSRGPMTNTKEAAHMYVSYDGNARPTAVASRTALSERTPEPLGQAKVTMPDPATASFNEITQWLVLVPSVTLAKAFRTLDVKYPGEDFGYAAAKFERLAGVTR